MHIIIYVYIVGGFWGHPSHSHVSYICMNMYSSCEYICPWKRENILEISEHSGRGGYESAFLAFMYPVHT